MYKEDKKKKEKANKKEKEKEKKKKKKRWCQNIDYDINAKGASGRETTE